MTDVHAAAAATTTERPMAAAAASTIAALIGVPAESVQLEAQSVDATGVRENGCDTPSLVTAPLCVRF